MRVKQTARKSTGTPQNRNARDAVQTRMRTLLVTKREKSETPSQNSFHQVSGRGKGKRISFSSYKNPVKTKPKAPSGTIALKEIKTLQKGWDLLIPRAPFHRLVRELTQKINDENYPEGDAPQIRYQTAALEAIQEACESYLTSLFEDSYLCTTHAKRVTLFVSDMKLCQRLQSRNDPKR